MVRRIMLVLAHESAPHHYGYWVLVLRNMLFSGCTTARQEQVKQEADF